MHVRGESKYPLCLAWSWSYKFMYHIYTHAPLASPKEHDLSVVSACLFFCCAVPCLTHSYSRLRRSSTSLSYIRGPVFSRGSSQQSSMSLEFLCCIHTCHASHASHSIESQLFLCMLHTHALAQVTRNNISFLGMLRCIHIFRCAAVVTSLSVIVSILYKQPVAA